MFTSVSYLPKCTFYRIIASATLVTARYLFTGAVVYVF